MELVLLDSTVDLVSIVSLLPIFPRRTRIVIFLRNLQTWYIGWPLQYIYIHASTQMPRDMAMERPDAGIVLIPLQHDIRRLLDGAATRDLLHIPSLWIAWVGDCSIPCPSASGQDLEVMAVQVHWVVGKELVVDDHANRRSAALVEDVPLRLEGIVTLGNVKQDR